MSNIKQDSNIILEYNKGWTNKIVIWNKKTKEIIDKEWIRVIWLKSYR